MPFGGTLYEQFKNAARGLPHEMKQRKPIKKVSVPSEAIS
jgi:hypothetical protein